MCTDISLQEKPIPMKTVGRTVSFWNDCAMVAFCIVINANAAFTFHFTALSTLIKLVIVALNTVLVVIVNLILAVVVSLIAVIRLYQPTKTVYVCSCVMSGAPLWDVCACSFVGAGATPL